MSGIASSVKLNDQFTPTLKRIEKNLDKVISKLIKLESAATKSMARANQAATKAAINEERLKRAVEQTAAARLKAQTQAQKLTQQELRTKQMVDKANASQQRFNNSMNRGVGIASRLGNAIKVGLGAYLGMQGITKTLGLADNLQMTTNRLDLLNDGKQTTEQLKQKIYESAMRSRADYLGTADSVAKMGLRTGDTFKSMDELIAFNETLNKMYAIAGTGAHEQFGATLQLIQALGSGVLRGQEFNAVFEAAPNVMQAVADHMNVPIEKLRDMAEDGAITADIIKNAMFEAAETTNEKFKKLKYTFGHVFTGLKNSAIHSFQPVLQQISDITSSERWIKFIDGVGVTIDRLAKASSKALDVITGVVGFVFDNWRLIEPILMGIAFIYIPSICLALKNMAVDSWKAFIPWLAANWIVLAIVAVFYLVIAVINKVTSVSVSATGIIFGAFAWLGAAIWDILLSLVVGALHVVDWIANGFIGLAELIYNACNNGFTGWISGVKVVWLSFVQWIYDLVRPLVELWDKFKGTNFAATIQGGIDADLSKATKGGTYKKFNRSNLASEATSLYINPNKAWEKGYNFGANLVGDLSLDNLGKTISGVTNGVGSDAGKYLKGGFADNPALDDIIKNTKDIANNTSVLKDEEDLSYMRDMATRNAINRHTTRNVKIEMVNNNSVSGDMDLNTVLQQIAKTVNDAVNVSASGIHY